MGKGMGVGGHVKISITNELKAELRKAGILRLDSLSVGRVPPAPHHLRPPKPPNDIPQQAWVPRWVRDAMKMYEKNDGFAGLTLVEFLATMNPEKKEE